MVILAAVVGGVLGSRAASGKSPATEESTSSPTPSPTLSPTVSVNTTTLRPNSRLAVTGRWDLSNPNVFEASLIFQGGDNLIRMSKLTRDAGEWGLPLALEGLGTAKPGSPLAASMVLGRGQFEFFYVATSGQLLGATWQSGDKMAKPDSITAPTKISAVMLNNDDTKLASYWPYIVAQYRNETLMKVVFYNGWDYAGRLDGDFGAELGSPLALVPTVTSMRNPDAAVGVLGRNKDGYLLNYGFGGDDKGSAWNTKPGEYFSYFLKTRNRPYISTNHSTAQSIPIPPVTALGALAVARPGSNLTNTYVLYQDIDDEIKTLRLDEDNKGWNTDSPKLGKADKGTDITCLTAQTGTGEGGVQIDLSDRRDMSRCYFMVGGLIKEVKLEDDGSWKELGFIPLE